MDERLRELCSEAVARLDHLLDEVEEIGHRDVHAAVNAVVACRDAAIAEHRAGRLSDAYLGRANALVSLAYGGEFPVSGLHRRRLEQTRDGVRALRDEA